VLQETISGGWVTPHGYRMRLHTHVHMSSTSDTIFNAEQRLCRCHLQQSQTAAVRLKHHNHT
jgi:hypothetical protein